MARPLDLVEERSEGVLARLSAPGTRGTAHAQMLSKS
jgi:hypothetical protein